MNIAVQYPTPYAANDQAEGRPSPQDMKRMYEEAKSIRALWEPDWRMCSAYCLPRHYSAWQVEGPASLSPQMQAARRFAFDATGSRAVPKFQAILQRIATPDGHRWHKVQSSNPYLNKQYRVRMYYDDLTTLLFRLRYDPAAMFTQCVGEMYTGLGVYGNAPVRITWRRPNWQSKTGGLLYKAMPLRDVFVLMDADGNLSVFFVRMWLNARQFVKKFPGVQPPKSIAAELMKPIPSETTFFEIVHVVHERTDYYPDALNTKRHPICSSYLSVQDGEYIGAEGGFVSYPYLMPRTATEPGDTYGYSPAMQAMPALGSVNAMKRTLLKQGQKAVDPPLLAHDDGVLSGRMGQTPGFVMWGGINAQGQKLVQPLEMGDFRVGEALLTDERNDINDAFMVTLFQILMETPEMTATEVIERLAEKAALAAPTMGRLQSGFLGPEIDRDIRLVAENAPWMLPEMPPELVEAEGEYTTIYTSPLAKGLTAEEDSGFFRMVEGSINVANATGDPSALDYYDFDTAIPEIADHMSVPARWMRSDDDVAAMREDRAKQAATQTAVQAAPAVASVAATMQRGQRAAA